MHDGLVQGEGEFRVLAEEKVEKFEDAVEAQEGLGLGEIQSGVFPEEGLQSIQVTEIQESKKKYSFFLLPR